MNADPKEYKRWYGRAVWLRLRTFVLQRDPVCVRCNRNPSTEVDHIVPHRGNWQRFIDDSNCQGLCGPCHSEKTAKEDGGFNHYATPVPGPKPAMTGDAGRQFVSSTLSSAALDRALGTAEEIAELLRGISDDPQGNVQEPARGDEHGGTQ